MNNNETIVGISTAVGGALSVIRVSGSDALNIVGRCMSVEIKTPRHAYYGLFSDGERALDEVVVLWFSAPASYTGEDVVEISCHGSRWVSMEIVRVLVSLGSRAAEAGEFTRRAFMNGKLDLSQAEAIGDLIASRSRASAEVALSQMRGGYTTLLSEMRSKLLHISSMLELELDFGEEDVEFASRDDLRTLLVDLRSECARLAGSFELGNVLKNGVPVAIVGLPNVGKSTLLNALVGEDRAIVSEIAGTTRDYIEETVNIEGVDFRFVDTAGIRATSDEVEAIGVERSLERMRMAKIVLQLVDDEGFDRTAVGEGQRLLTVGNKSDLGIVKGCDLCVSARSGEGLEDLRKRLVELSGVLGYDGSEVIVSNLRHYEALGGVIESTDEALLAIEEGFTGDLIASSLAQALERLGEITGEFTTDEILANIFRNFCIGK